MKKAHRAIIGACAALATLVFASAAFATYAPKLVVGATGSQARIGVTVAASDDPTAQTLIYVPNGYQIATATPGTTLGAVTATVASADLGGVVVPVTGSLIAIDPTTLSAAGKQAVAVCSQNGTPSQTWDLHLSAAGQALDVPLVVIPANQGEQALGYAAKLCAFLPPPDVPASNPNRSPLGAKLLSVTFNSSAITQPASGTFRWTSLFTPYTPNTGAPNKAGTVETQSVRTVPVALSVKVTKKKVTKKVKGKKVTSTLVKVTSSVSGGNGTATTTAAGKKVGSAGFSLAKGKSAKVVVTAKVNASSGSVPTGTPTATTDLFYRDLGASGCTATAAFGGLPCVDATAGGETLTKTVTVKGF